MSYPNGTSDVLPAGDYYVAVFSNYNGSDGDYRLVVQGGYIPTSTPTPVAPIASFVAQDSSTIYGWQNTGGIAVNSAGTSLYLSYNFQASYYYIPDIQAWTSSDGVNYSASATWTISGGAPEALTTDATGNLYITDSGNNYIYKYSPSGTALLTFGNYNSYGYAMPGYLYGVSGVGVDSSGNVYVGENGASYTVQTFNSSGANQAAWNVGCCDAAVAVNSAGTTVYVTDGTLAVYLYTAAGSAITQWYGSSGTYTAITVSPGGPQAGNVYATDSTNNQVVEFNPTGNLVSEWGSTGTAPGQFNRAAGVAVDGTGNIYVADYGSGRVQKFAPR